MSASSRAFAGIRQGEDRVVDADHAEIAVARLGRMDELRRGAGRGQRRGDLARDMAAFADAGDDQPAAHRGADIEGERRKRRRASAPSCSRPVDFGADHPPRRPRCPAAAGGASPSSPQPASMPSCADDGDCSIPQSTVPRDRDHCSATAAHSPPALAQCAKMSCSAQPSRSSSARCRQEIEASPRQLERGPRAPASHRAGRAARAGAARPRRRSAAAPRSMMVRPNPSSAAASTARPRASPCTDRAARACR